MPLARQARRQNPRRRCAVPSTDDWYAQRQTQGEGAALIGIVRTVTATLTSSTAKPIIDVTPIPAHTNEMGVFELALDSVCLAYRGMDLFKLVTYDAGACSAHNATLVRARDLHYLFGLTAGQPTLLQEAKRWLGPRKLGEADVCSEDFERGHRVETCPRAALVVAILRPNRLHHARSFPFSHSAFRRASCHPVADTHDRCLCRADHHD